MKADWEWIDTADKTRLVLSALEPADRAAIDIEADSFYRYKPKVCLIQLAVTGHLFLIDPLAKCDVQAILEHLSQKRLVIHDAGFDLRLLFAGYQFQPQKPIFDTMLAARLTGHHSVSLAALLNAVLNVELSKKSQRSDWAVRPLPKELMTYAIEDVRYLFELADHLQKRLSELNRLDWHQEYCQKIVQAAMEPQKSPQPDKQWRIAGASKLSARQLAFLKELWLWRQQQAEKANASAFRILRNEELLRWAIWADKQTKIPGPGLLKLPKSWSDKKRQSFYDALQNAANQTSADWPNHLTSDTTKRPSQKTLDKVEQLRQICIKTAHQLGIDPPLLASRKALLAAVNAHADSAEKLTRLGWMRWQIDLLLQPIQNVLNEKNLQETDNAYESRHF